MYLKPHEKRQVVLLVGTRITAALSRSAPNTKMEKQQILLWKKVEKQKTV